MTRGRFPHALLLLLVVGCAGPKYIGAEEAVCSAERDVDLACGDDSLCLSRACVPHLKPPDGGLDGAVFAVEIVPAPPAPTTPPDGGAPPTTQPTLTQLGAETFGPDAVRLTTTSTSALTVTFAYANAAMKPPTKATVLLTVNPGIPGLPDLTFQGDYVASLNSATLSIPEAIARRPGTLQLSPWPDEGTWPPFFFPVIVPDGDPLLQTVGNTVSVRGTLRTAGGDPVPDNSFEARAFRGGAPVSNAVTVGDSGKYALQISADAGPAQVTITFSPKSNSETERGPGFASNPVTLPVTSVDVTLPAYEPPQLFALPLQTDANDPLSVVGTRVHATTTMLPSPLGTTTYSWDAVVTKEDDGRAPLALLPGTEPTPRPYTFTITPPVGSPFATTCLRQTKEDGVRRGGKASTPPAPLTAIMLPRRKVVSGTVVNATLRGVFNVVVTATLLTPAPPDCIPEYLTTSATTDLQGKFQLMLDPGSYRFDYDPAPGAPVPRKTESRVEVADDVSREVRLDQAAYVEGIVRGRSDVRLPMAIVRLYCTENCGVPGPQLRAQAQTDATGRFIAVVPRL